MYKNDNKNIHKLVVIINDNKWNYDADDKLTQHSYCDRLRVSIILCVISLISNNFVEFLQFYPYYRKQTKKEFG